MSEPITGTGLAGGALTGASLYGLLTGTDYGVVFGAFAGSVFYIATAADLSVTRRMAYFVVSYIAGVLCAGLVGSKLSALTGYSDKPLDAIGAVIISALAVKILTFLNNQDIGSLVALITRRGGSGGTK
ncbi:phage holin family protein [Klebsiella grimontii]|uniref:phage holin family protein n=1 Tax=Klebsiella grimontii TaxID=2058152 RepID=UPI0012B980AA|nr:phage holin family protein [Klebsiella grimontii]QMR64919.1 phage holin family protein [Klebsiella grimontii]WDC45150.1 phage holin family protein [Klebsiella grimontii]